MPKVVEECYSLQKILERVVGLKIPHMSLNCLRMLRENSKGESFVVQEEFLGQQVHRTGTLPHQRVALAVLVVVGTLVHLQQGILFL